MAHTNSTTHYSLPQFLSTDKPAWLTDVNPAYEAIDTGIYNAKSAADAAQSDATQALSDASTAGTTASSADAKASGAIASIAESFDTTATYSVGDYVVYNNLLYECTVAVTTPGTWTGTTNWTRATVDSIASDLKSDITNLNIQDLANVSLDSSDNNKLLSVAVDGGGNISVDAAEIETITISAKQYVTINNAQAFKVGRMCFISFSFTASSATNAICTLSVLPYNYVMVPLGVDGSNTGTSMAYITPSGSLSLNSNVIANKNYAVNVCYISQS